MTTAYWIESSQFLQDPSSTVQRTQVVCAPVAEHGCAEGVLALHIRWKKSNQSGCGVQRDGHEVFAADDYSASSGLCCLADELEY